MTQILLTLYVAGRTPRSQQAIASLRRICDQLDAAFALTVVDVTTDPESAERDRVLTTPTVVKRAPAPARRVTGDLSDHEQVIFGLALRLHELDGLPGDSR